MIVKYYKDNNLSYANRKRFSNLSFVPFNTEEHKSILLGDGANTQIKTKKSNICDYVTIDDTRWFVTSYVYCNGGQVILYLQRDVIGEMGLGDCFGKIERGYTESVLRNRKELGLNQVLKDRKKILPITNQYGQYSVDNHEKELWGILYFVKPSDGSESINVNIPAFNPEVVDYEFIENDTVKYYKDGFSCKCNVGFRFSFYGYDRVYSCSISFYFDEANSDWVYNVFISQMTSVGADFEIKIRRAYTTTNVVVPESVLDRYAREVGISVAKRIINRAGDTEIFYSLPSVENLEDGIVDYNGITIKNEDIYYSYSTKKETYNIYGKSSTSGNLYNKVIQPAINGSVSNYQDGAIQVQVQFYLEEVDYPYPDFSGIFAESFIIAYGIKYNYEIIPPESAGEVVIDVSQQLVDEPFCVFAFPLYNVKITGDIEYNINKTRAFNIFNTFIQTLSGENGYIVDAQVYPYCPFLTKVAFKLFDYPFFCINSTSYNTYCKVQLLPDLDVKKEYIKRTYSLISPEKTGKFNFNFYDYKTRLVEQNGVNIEELEIIIKTALKPFGIISSAVITPDGDSIVGITYDSDLRGCQPTGNGFQCSLSSNAFETYKRQNSNYQQIFALQKQELEISHATEVVNETTNAVIATTNAALMGGMAGAAVADGFWGDFVHSQAVGGAVGAVAAGATVGVAQGIQISQNNKLREFEKYLQQQMFDFEIGTIKNLPNSINRISSFNEIILKDFCYIIEIYECTDFEKIIVDNFISKYGYGIGVFDFVSNYKKSGWFLRSTLVSSNYPPNLHNIASKELMGGIYLYE